MFATRLLYRPMEDSVTVFGKSNKASTFVCILMALTSLSCSNKEDGLQQAIDKEFSSTSGSFALAFRDLKTGKELLIQPDEKYHAASTMKVPVMLELYRQAAAGEINLRDSIEIHTRFQSIVDTSHYELSVADDSEASLYGMGGQRWPIDSLMVQMIIASSNLATNLLIEKADAGRVTKTLRDMGLQNTDVLRGVEDGKAFRKGLNNQVTARDLMILLTAIAEGKAVNQASSDDMLNILLRQKFNEIIPAHLPEGVKVAHKTGWITGHHHDAAIVMLPDGRRYVLVLLSRDLKDEAAGVALMARVSRLIYDYAVSL